MLTLYAVVDRGLARITQWDDTLEAHLALGEERLQCVALDPRDPATVYAGSRDRAVWKSEDDGATWHRLDLPAGDVFSLAVSPVDGAVYAGTEPSMIFRSDDGGSSWRELEALRRIPSAPTWSFPPRPWTSHVRWIAPNPADAGLLLAGIELGGLMRSTDGGETWEDHRPGAQRDVHALAWHPRAAERAYEAGGGGAAWSFDAGRTWLPADEGRDRHYTWALAVDPDDPDTWYVSASTGPRAAHRGADAQAYLYRWRAAGPWERLGGGLPEPLDSMPYALLALPGRLFAGLADGRIYVSRDGGGTWALVEVEGERLAGIRALAAANGASRHA
ncbi:MAG TPA: hypothetical protein VF192_09205 [Longimicrobiales bacterium]